MLNRENILRDKMAEVDDIACTFKLLSRLLDLLHIIRPDRITDPHSQLAHLHKLVHLDCTHNRSVMSDILALSLLPREICGPSESHNE